MEAFLFVADRTSCADDRWKRVKKSMIAAAVGSNDPELCMEVFQYIRDREPKTEGGQWDMFVLDFLLPFDLSDMMDLQSLWKMVQEHHALSAEEEFCRVISRAMRQAGQADLADEMGLSRAGKKVVPLRPKKAGFSSGLRAQSLLRLVA